MPRLDLWLASQSSVMAVLPLGLGQNEASGTNALGHLLKRWAEHRALGRRVRGHASDLVHHVQSAPDDC